MVQQLNLVDHGDKIAKAAFRILLNEATSLPMATLAERIGVDEQTARQALDDLKLIGRVETDDNRLLGVYGLTLKPTQHRMTLRGATFFTWCAYDSIGIPAALGESADVTSECAECQSTARISIVNGEPPPSPITISWLSAKCDSIRDQFCPTVNFYCDSTHYETALKAGRAPDVSLSLERAAEMGRENWGWALPEPSRSSAHPPRGYDGTRHRAAARAGQPHRS